MPPTVLSDLKSMTAPVRDYEDAGVVVVTVARVVNLSPRDHRTQQSVVRPLQADNKSAYAIKAAQDGRISECEGPGTRPGLGSL